MPLRAAGGCVWRSECTVVVDGVNDAALVKEL